MTPRSFSRGYTRLVAARKVAVREAHALFEAMSGGTGLVDAAGLAEACATEVLTEAQGAALATHLARLPAGMGFEGLVAVMQRDAAWH